MEIFAFTQNSVGYEDPGAEPQLRSFDEINLEIPKSAIAGAVGTVAAVGIIGAAPDAHALVRPGAQCAAVGSIQQAVGVSADNVYGPITTSAVRSFQSRNGLLIDGIVGPSTASALGLPTDISCLTSTPPVSGTSYTVTASALNVRATPSTAGQVLTTLSNGTQINVSSFQGGWAKLAGQAGWVSGAYITGGGGTTTPPVGGGGAYSVKASALRVRATPSSAGQIITTLPNGTRVNITSVNSDGWAKLAGQPGWVAFYLLE